MLKFLSVSLAIMFCWLSFSVSDAKAVPPQASWTFGGNTATGPYTIYFAVEITGDFSLYTTPANMTAEVTGNGITYQWTMSYIETISTTAFYRGWCVLTSAQYANLGGNGAAISLNAFGNGIRISNSAPYQASTLATSNLKATTLTGTGPSSFSDRDPSQWYPIVIGSDAKAAITFFEPAGNVAYTTGHDVIQYKEGNGDWTDVEITSGMCVYNNAYSGVGGTVINVNFAGLAVDTYQFRLKNVDCGTTTYSDVITVVVDS